MKNRRIKDLLIFLGILILSSISLTCFITPATKENTDYSADRAWENLRVISESPRPSGSEQLRKIERFIVDELQNSGVTPQIMEHSVIGLGGDSVTVRNIYVEIKSTNEQSALFIAHYDSEANSPGAGDNGMAVATLLESIKAVKGSIREFKTGIKILFTDGEELGLLGSTAFVQSHTEFLEDVLFVVNAEGFCSGPVMIIEGNNLANIYFNSISKPLGFSAISAISAIPNAGMRFDTLPFLEKGLHSMTIATIGGSMNYHSPGDNFENASHESQIRYVDSVYGFMRKVAETQANQWSDLLTLKDRTYFMLAYNVLISYGGGVGIVLALAAVALAVVSAILYRRKNEINIGRLLFISVGILLLPILCVIASRVLFWVISVITWNPLIEIPFYKMEVTVAFVIIVNKPVPLAEKPLPLRPPVFFRYLAMPVQMVLDRPARIRTA